VILELRNPNARNENYRPLFSELENIGRCLTQFVWVVKSGLPAGDLCRSLGASTWRTTTLSRYRKPGKTFTPKIGRSTRPPG